MYMSITSSKSTLGINQVKDYILAYTYMTGGFMGTPNTTTCIGKYILQLYSRLKGLKTILRLA